jgi:hypothetical protein
VTFRHLENEVRRIDDIVQHKLLLSRMQWQKTAQDAMGRPLTKSELEHAKRWVNMGETVERFIEWLLRKKESQ